MAKEIRPVSDQPNRLRPDLAVESEHAELTNRVLGGDREALGKLFEIYRPRLWRMVTFRLHPCLQGRIDADDVLQDAWLQAVERIDHFFEAEGQSSFLWFRSIVAQTLLQLHRFHLGTKKRNAARERSIHSSWGPGATSSCLAFHLSDSVQSPSSSASRAEVMKQIDVILQGMEELDREVLALRHFESLTNSEVAKILHLTEQAASIRYIRALGRLKLILEFALPSAFGK